MFLIKYENRFNISIGYFNFHPQLIISLQNHCYITVQYLFSNKKINKRKFFIFLHFFDKFTLKNLTKNPFYS